MFVDPILLRLQETVSIGEAFKRAELDLIQAIEMLGDDEIRWEMVSYLIPRLEQLESKLEGARTMAVPERYNRDFLLEELRSMTVEQSAIAAEIRSKMEELDGTRPHTLVS